MEPIPYPRADRSLAIRLEKAEAWSNREFIEARSRIFPESSATWMEAAGAFALFDFKGSPLTQTFALGMDSPVTPGEMETIESFFRNLGSDTYHEVSPLSDPSTLSLLNVRGYHPIEFSNVLYRPIDSAGPSDAPGPEAISVRCIRAGEEEAWSATSWAGWSEFEDLSEFVLGAGRVFPHQKNTALFLADLHDSHVATGMLSLRDGVALFAGASTIPSARKQGAQLALFEARLRYAAESGCDLAMMCAQPGSASQRNAERHGFRIAYTRIKWHLGARISSYTM